MFNCLYLWKATNVHILEAKKSKYLAFFPWEITENWCSPFILSLPWTSELTQKTTRIMQYHQQQVSPPKTFSLRRIYTHVATGASLTQQRKSSLCSHRQTVRDSVESLEEKDFSCACRCALSFAGSILKCLIWENVLNPIWTCLLQLYRFSWLYWLLYLPLCSIRVELLSYRSRIDRL